MRSRKGSDRLRLALGRVPFLKRAVLATRGARVRATERLLGVDTITPPAALLERSSAFADGNVYEGLDYALIRRYVRILQPEPEDVMFDIGCGLGRIVFAFARENVKKCVGIDVSPELIDKALENARGLRGRRAAIELLAQDAAIADYSEGTLYVLFHPFGGRTMDVVLDRIGETLRTNPRRIRIAYVHPVHEDVLASKSWLECFARTSSPFTKVRASFWRNGPDGALAPS